jgi:hypothetical protein
MHARTLLATADAIVGGAAFAVSTRGFPESVAERGIAISRCGLVAGRQRRFGSLKATLLLGCAVEEAVPV